MACRLLLVLLTPSLITSEVAASVAECAPDLAPAVQECQQGFDDGPLLQTLLTGSNSRRGGAVGAEPRRTHGLSAPAAVAGAGAAGSSSSSRAAPAPAAESKDGVLVQVDVPLQTDGVRLNKALSNGAVLVHVLLLLIAIGVLCLGMELFVVECLIGCLHLGDGRRGQFISWLTELPRRCYRLLEWSLLVAASGVESAASACLNKARSCLCPGCVLAPAVDLPGMTPCLVRDVASFLPADALCMLGGASKSFHAFSDELCSCPLLLDEVRRLGAEREWLRELRRIERHGNPSCFGDGGAPSSAASEGGGDGDVGGGQADGKAAAAEVAEEEVPPAVSPSVLRRFLALQRLRQQQSSRRESAQRLSEVACDALRFILLSVCWLSFLCQVVSIARQSPPMPTLKGAVKALVSPVLFLYVLEIGEEHLVQATLAGAISLFLMLDCLLDGSRPSWTSSVLGFNHTHWASV
mmetsp:Transcript_52357/g.150068  ORF Transcript_52357/g.150068 Transcript_52357/m.150068 type:complete len:466 (+) Transcript_52357:58-1455(+)